MEIRKIKAQTVCDTVKKLFTDCNYFIGKDIMCALETARDNESSPVGKSVLSQIIENDKIAAREEVPLCQDTKVFRLISQPELLQLTAKELR